MAVDTEQEDLQFLNSFGIIRESLKILRSHINMFIALTLTLTLPLCFVVLGYNLITQPLTERIIRDSNLAQQERDTSAEERIERRIDHELITLYIILVVYLLSLLAFSLLSTSAIVYSVACIYSEKVTSYREVLKVVPSVWRRLIVTFLWSILFVSVYIVLAFVALLVLGAVLAVLLGPNALPLQRIVFYVAVVFIVRCYVYVNCVWHLASVVTVLEKSDGVEAMKKSIRLLKGKTRIAYVLSLMHTVCTLLIGLAFYRGVVHIGDFLAHPLRIVLGCALILLLSVVDLVGLLVQTVFYFACKAHHKERIDRVVLSEHLGAYLGEYVPLRSAIQMEEAGP